MREKQVRPNLSKYTLFAVQDKLNPGVRPGYERRDVIGNRSPAWQELYIPPRAGDRPDQPPHMSRLTVRIEQLKRTNVSNM